MKAYGLRDKFKYNYRDYTSDHYHENWWEFELNTVKSKKSARQKNKKIIHRELIEV